MRTLGDTDSHTFRTRLKLYLRQYGDFLNERTINPATHTKEWTHKKLRSSALSLVNLEIYLFTYEHNKKIPTTTNSLEGHFRHINEVTAIHCGLSRTHKERVLHSLLLAGSVAPNDEKLREIL